MIRGCVEPPSYGAWLPACRLRSPPPSRPPGRSEEHSQLVRDAVLSSSSSSPSQRVFPYISAMVNNGSFAYDHDRDGRPTELGGCTAMVRNLNHDTFLVIRYVKRRLTVSACPPWPLGGLRDSLPPASIPEARLRGGLVWTASPPPLFQVLLDIDGKHEWRDCVDIPGVHLPRGYYFGVSAVTGDLSGTVEAPA